MTQNETAIEQCMRIIYIATSVISAIMLLLNIITCLIFFSAANRHIRPKLLLGNIALADSCLIIILFIKLRLVNQVILYVLYTFDYITAFTIPLISIDRYYKFVHPLEKNPFDSIPNKVFLALIWLTSAIVSLPFLVTINLYYIDNETLTMKCLISKLSIADTFPFIETTRFAIAIRSFALLVGYLIPLVVIIYFCSRIICYFNFHKTSERQMNERLRHSAVKITKLMVAVMTLFAVAHGILAVVDLMVLKANDINGNLERCATFSPEMTLTFVVFMTSAICNPIVYYLLSKSYRRDLLYMIQCAKQRKLKEFFFESRRRLSSASTDIIRI